MFKALISCITVVALLASPAVAQGKKLGFDEETTSTQGNGGRTNTNANPDNEGQTVEETTGPKGQLMNGNTDCNNCESEVVDLPGKNR